MVSLELCDQDVSDIEEALDSPETGDRSKKKPLTVAKVLGLRIVMDERYPGSKVSLKKESGSRSEKGYQASAQSQKAGAKSRNATSHCPL